MLTSWKFLTEGSVARLFLGGFIPGIIMGLSLMGMIYWLVVTGRVHAPSLPRQPMSVLWRAFWRTSLGVSVLMGVY